MKRILLTLAIAFALAAPLRAAEDCSTDKLPVCKAIDGAETNVDSSTVFTAPYSIVGAQIWSTAGSTATVEIQCRTSTVAPWYPCYTVSNPDATGYYPTLPRSYQYRAHLVWTAGTVYVNFERYRY